MRKIILIICLNFIIIGCSVVMLNFQEVETKIEKKLSIMSSVRFKTFVYVDENKYLDIYIKSGKIPNMKEFSKMEYDSTYNIFVYELKIGDYSFYRKIKKDTIIIKKGDKIEKYIMIQNEK